MSNETLLSRNFSSMAYTVIYVIKRTLASVILSNISLSGELGLDQPNLPSRDSAGIRGQSILLLLPTLSVPRCFPNKFHLCGYTVKYDNMANSRLTLMSRDLIERLPCLASNRCVLFI